MNDVNPPLSEHSEWNMTEEPLSKDEKKDLYERLERECSVRDACGCKGVPPTIESFEQRMSTVDQMFEKGGLSQNIEADTNTQCSRESVENLLSRYLHPQALIDIQERNQNSISTRQGTAAWKQVRSLCSDAVPMTIEQFYE
tara:strand:+ start:585 stop:1010 length:426 start_codon:yes stop_codon:yes gene_type:complete